MKKGTNGAVTIHGLLAAAVAGFVIGVCFTLVGVLTTECYVDVAWRQLLVVPISTAAGLLGSLIDSLLGATLQFSGYCTVRKKVIWTCLYSLHSPVFCAKTLSINIFPILTKAS